MFRLLSPWSSAPGGDKVTPEEAKLFVAKQRMSPGMDTPKSSKLKRKRAESSGSDSGRNGRAPTKMRLDRAPQVVIPKTNGATNHVTFGTLNGGIEQRSNVPSCDVTNKWPNDTVNGSQTVTGNGDRPPINHAEEPATKCLETPPATQETPPSQRMYSPRELEDMRRTIESQLSLEILLKHNELRLIDQEIAKCQVALEQLRRCHEIPYPVSSPSGAVSNGTGPALRHAPPLASPAPWGVTDGPYTRHYARWLIPDQIFDGEVESPMEQRAVAGKLPAKGRGLRGGYVDSIAAAGTSRAHRGSTGSKLQALSNGYPQPRDKAGPMIQKRKSDGQVVKLVCLDCRRDNFSSAQGFINHCRIAHSRNFASHDAAADACGEPVEIDEAGALVGGNNEPPTTATAGIVHPLIRSAHLLKPNSTNEEQLSTPDANKAMASTEAPPAASTTRKPARKPRHETTPNASFVPSPEAPNLSALLQSRGLGLDLQNLVTDAKSHPDVFDSSSDDGSNSGPEDTLMEDGSAMGGHLTIRGGHLTARQPARATMSPAPLERPGSRKGLGEPPSRKPPRFLEPLQAPQPPPYSSPYAATGLGIRDSSPPNLSPDTVESNQAPSLVSDDEYEAHSESESSPSSAGGDDDGGDFNVEVEDDESATTTTTTTDPDLPGPPKQHAHPVRRASAFRRGAGDREEKHVSFVSPSPAPASQELSNPKKGSARRKSKG